jgi:lysophospholipase L1-like esterase
MVNMGVNGYSALETAWTIETYAPELNPKMIIINLFPNDVHGDFIKVIKGKENFEPNYKQMFQYLERVRTYCATMGIQFVVAVIPSKEQISVMKEYGVFQDRAKSWCDEKEVPFADSRAHFNTFDWEQLYFTWDPHFSTLGHKHYSDFLYEFTQTTISNAFQPDALN